MTVSMSRADLSAFLLASLHDVSEVFVNGVDDMVPLLETAALDFSRHRPLTMFASLLLEPDRVSYPAPVDMVQFKSSLWGIAPDMRAKYWDRNWPGRLPEVQMVQGVAGKELHFSPPPRQLMISQLGSDFRYYYYAAHKIGAGESETTIYPADRHLLILRAQAEAMRELTMRNVKKPVRMNDGLHSHTKNMTPAALHAELLKEWEMKISRLGV